MALKFGLTDARKMLAVLDPEYAEWQAQAKANKKAGTEDEELLDRMADAEDFGKAALEAALEIIQAKAKFTVVGQVTWKPGEEPGDKVALDWYGTEKNAVDDALKLTYSPQTHETAKAWVLPIFHGTPANWFTQRKADKKHEGDTDAAAWFREVERRQQWFEDNPGKPPPEDWRLVIPFYTPMEACPFCDGSGRVAIETSERSY